jgi:hypothetical protein
MKKRKVRRLIEKAEAKIHKYYWDLGVRVNTTVHPFVIPTEPLKEGQPSTALNTLTVTQDAYIVKKAYTNGREY